MILCRKATVDDVPWLGEMNHQLIADEGHSNPMSIRQLEDRMRTWLLGDYFAFIFNDPSCLCGYALLREEPDKVYLRQFFIVRGRRRKGLGRASMELLIKTLQPRNKKLALDVLIKNEAAIQFYKSVGFQPYCLTMEWKS